MFTNTLTELPNNRRFSPAGILPDQVNAIRRWAKQLSCDRCGSHYRFRCAEVAPGPILAVQFTCVACYQFLNVYGESAHLEDANEAVSMETAQ
jgi:hypothetical protein